MNVHAIIKTQGQENAAPTTTKGVKIMNANYAINYGTTSNDLLTAATDAVGLNRYAVLYRDPATGAFAVKALPNTHNVDGKTVSTANDCETIHALTQIDHCATVFDASQFLSAQISTVAAELGQMYSAQHGGAGDVFSTKLFTTAVASRCEVKIDRDGHVLTSLYDMGPLEWHLRDGARLGIRYGRRASAVTCEDGHGNKWNKRRVKRHDITNFITRFIKEGFFTADDAAPADVAEAAPGDVAEIAPAV